MVFELQEQAKRVEEEEKMRIEQKKQEQQLQLEETSRHEEAIKEVCYVLEFTKSSIRLGFQSSSTSCSQG